MSVDLVRQVRQTQHRVVDSMSILLPSSGRLLFRDCRRSLRATIKTHMSAIKSLAEDPEPVDTATTRGKERKKANHGRQMVRPNTLLTSSVKYE